MTKKNDKKQHRIFEERKREFLSLFAKEAQEIRDSIVKDLPAYNAILFILAESFEEVALRLLAEERGIPFDRTSPPIPDLPILQKYNCAKERRKNLLMQGL